MKTSIGIDLGGTNIKGLLTNELGEVLATYNFPTHEESDNWKLGVKKVHEYLETINEGPADAVGLSAPGLANEQNSAIAYLPNRLEGLEGFLWAEFLERQTYVLNDAHAALMAEAKFGSLKEYKNALMLTLGTGIGGGILINKELYQGQFQRAGHLGHMGINVNDDELSILGIPGSLEYALGNYSIRKRTHDKYGSTKELVQAYLANETLATHIWLNSLKKLAVSLASLVNVFSPEAICLSGGIVLAGDALFKPLKDFLEIYEFNPYKKATPILKSVFDDQAGAIGAAAFALTKY